MASETYHETFANGAGGWLSWLAGGGGPRRLHHQGSTVTARSPWGVDYNHAPPGGGYLHLPFVLMTGAQQWPELGGENRFVAEGWSTDLTDATMTLRLRGEVTANGAEFLLLAQGDTGPVISNQVLQGQPFTITRDWSEQTIHLVPDQQQWLQLGTRGDGAHSDRYGDAPIADLLRQVNVDLILVFFPLDIVPAEPISGDPHRLRAGHDYRVDESRLVSGWVELDEVQIAYP